jgi:hypothetical protein
MTKRLQDRFEVYHKENPRVYELFVKFAKEVKAAGFKNFSANAIFERIRWYVSVETVGDKFKVNDNYRPYYARKMMQDFPEFEGFLNIRKLKE